MGMVKKLLTFVLVGWLLGSVVASLIAPGLLAWYQEPGTGKAMCECAEVARDTTSSLLKWQTIGGFLGALSMFVVGIVFSVRSGRRTPTGTTPSGGGTPPSPPSEPPATPPVAPPTP